MQRRPTLLRLKESPVLVLAPIALIAILLVGWHYHAASRGRVSPPEQLIWSILEPVQLRLSRLGRWGGAQWTALTGWKQLSRENRSLQQQVAELEAQNRHLLPYLEENERLRQMLKLTPGIAAREIAAEVISIETQRGHERVWINRGRQHGIRADDPVISVSGLVGRVLRCDGHRSYVLLITDPEARVGARCARSGAMGIVRGMGNKPCRLEYLDPGADVREGDALITSGHGSVFPKGLHIGTVLEVNKNIREPSQVATVEPAAALNRLDQVFVLRIDPKVRKLP